MKGNKFMDEILKKKIEKMTPLLNERQLRQYLASEAEALGFGGIETIMKISGKSRNTIKAGIKDNNSDEEFGERIRRIGGGRKALTEHNPEIINDIERIVSDNSFGNPEEPLSYTTKSLAKIKNELNEKGYLISTNVIAKILKTLGYSLQLNQKMLQVGEQHPDRDVQFEFINSKTKEFTATGIPVISIDAKKKELVGNFKNNGKTYEKEKTPKKVLDHDFPLKELGKVTPYGVYDINKNEGFVNLGISRDTAEFAVESVARWWQTLGKNTYQDATEIYITCDGGGSNGSRLKLWKYKIQQFSNITGLTIHISHYPPGTSKWNKIEHRMFCFISSNWRGQPLISIETIINLIGSTTTKKGLKIVCKKDNNEYRLGEKVSDKDFETINISRCKTCPDWNYTISPQ